MRLLIALGLLLVACGGTVIGAGNYDQRCMSDVDCAPVYQGDACGICTCPNTAVNVDQLTRYEADLASLKKLCGPQPAVACGPCAPRRGLCTSRQCSARPD